MEERAGRRGGREEPFLGDWGERGGGVLVSFKRDILERNGIMCEKKLTLENI